MMRSSFTIARATLAAVLVCLLIPATVSADERGCLGDINGDGTVDLGDLAILLAAYDTCVGDTFYNPDADLDDSGCVDLADLATLLSVYGTNCPDELITTELAGNSLDEYPYFEYVRAFNEDATVEVAIDPTRFPGIVGVTGDIYVVSAKTEAQWSANPTLVDVTSGGAQTETFGGATIQDNTFLVTGPYELSADAGIGLGVGYDVVIDLNRDGELNAGDIIDGLSDEAGLYAVHDTTQPGPMAVTEVGPYSVGPIFGIPYSITSEMLYYPTDIASLEPAPLILIGHGFGHDYRWYGHIGHHLASYGCIVVSFQNGYSYTGSPTLGHTDAVLELQDTIAGGALNGKIDSTRIIWIGHSVGGEGVLIAFGSLVDGVYTPTHYSADSIVLISSMAPVANEGVSPRHANFHLWTGSGDTDVYGGADCHNCQTYNLHDRATGYRMSTTVQGAGHAWFHDGPAEPSYFEGPCPIGQENTHLIQLGLFLPLVKYFTEGNIPASDFLWRQYERFHPIGVDTSDPCIVVTNEFRNGSADGNFFIDDYQTQPSLDVSSSGGTVEFTVQNVTEGRLDDNNSDFVWTASDPFNGATQATWSDQSRGVVFDWNGADRYYEWEVISEERDFSDDLYLSFRGAQGTWHPYTLAVLGDLTFSVTLRDGVGRTSSINIGAYGGGLEQPYQRRGGWHNEMEVVRIRLTDFLANGSEVDLTDIVAVRFDVGPSWGSNEGRIVVDELMLTQDFPPALMP